MIAVQAFLADAVEATAGKLFALGVGWNLLSVPVIPMRFPRIGIGLLIEIPYTDTNEPHSFAVRIDDADGHPLPLGIDPTRSGDEATVTRIGGEFNVGRPPHLQPGDEQIVTLGIQLDGVVFERAERYAVVVEIDGEDAKRLPFRVRHVPPPAGSSS